MCQDMDRGKQAECNLDFQQKKKNNHFVPRSYLKRFSSLNKKQIALYNIKSGTVVVNAPIKSQCSKDYFYTKNPIYEEKFQEIEDAQLSLINSIIEEKSPPKPDMSFKPWRDLLACVMFQAGRTASQVVHADHFLNQLGKAMLRHQFEREGNAELLEYLPDVTLSTTNAVLDSIMQHLIMHPLLSDLECVLLLNETSEDFLTSDHPVALCNSIPSIRPGGASLGFASRGLIVVYPISPRASLMFSDPEVYRINSQKRLLSIYKKHDIVELNLMQFGNAYENVYFSTSSRVEQTLDAFRRRAATFRPPLPLMSEASASLPDKRRGILLMMEPAARRLPLPRGVEIRRAARTGKYRTGNTLVRNPFLISLVDAELERVQALREQATARAKSEDDPTPS